MNSWQTASVAPRFHYKGLECIFNIYLGGLSFMLLYKSDKYNSPDRMLVMTVVYQVCAKFVGKIINIEEMC